MHKSPGRDHTPRQYRYPVQGSALIGWNLGPFRLTVRADAKNLSATGLLTFLPAARSMVLTPSQIRDRLANPESIYVQLAIDQYDDLAAPVLRAQAVRVDATESGMAAAFRFTGDSGELEAILYHLEQSHGKARRYE